MFVLENAAHVLDPFTFLAQGAQVASKDSAAALDWRMRIWCNTGRYPICHEFAQSWGRKRVRRARGWRGVCEPGWGKFDMVRLASWIRSLKRPLWFLLPLAAWAPQPLSHPLPASSHNEVEALRQAIVDLTATFAGRYPRGGDFLARLVRAERI